MKNAMSKMENNCRIMPSILGVSCAGVSLFFTYYLFTSKENGIEGILILLLMIIFCIGVAIVSFYCILKQRELAMKPLSEKQKELFISEIKGEDLKVYTLKNKILILTKNFIVEENGATFFPHPRIVPMENLLCIETFTFYDAMAGSDFATVRYIDNNFKGMGLSPTYSVLDAKEVIDYIKNIVPYIDVIDGSNNMNKFEKMISTKKGKEEYRDMINKRIK